MFTPIPGEMIQFADDIFQMGWFNHQLDKTATFTVMLEGVWTRYFLRSHFDSRNHLKATKDQHGSTRLTWLAGKATMNEDVSPIRKLGEFQLGVMSSYTLPETDSF